MKKKPLVYQKDTKPETLSGDILYHYSFQPNKNIMLEKICVYCGSSLGASPIYTDAMRELGRTIARNGLTLVYGGSHAGQMGIIADEVLKNGGKVIGIMTEHLDAKGLSHERITELHIVKDMQARKAEMIARADAFIAAPGGIGTLEEYFETLSGNQMGLHKKPIGLYNVGGYYDPLMAAFRSFEAQDFMRNTKTAELICEGNAQTLIDQLKARS